MLMNSNCNNRIKPFEAFLGGNILGMKFKVLTESGEKTVLLSRNANNSLSYLSFSLWL